MAMFDVTELIKRIVKYLIDYAKREKWQYDLDIGIAELELIGNSEINK